MAGETVARKGDEGQAYWFLGGLYEVVLSSDETGGAMTQMRITLPPGAGSPPHVHAEAESLYVLEGELDVHIGDETVAAGAGSQFHFPAGTLEWSEAVTQVTALNTYVPGGIDKFFAAVGEPALSRTLPPPSDTPPDFERLAAIAAEHRLQIRPPG